MAGLKNLPRKEKEIMLADLERKLKDGISCLKNPAVKWLSKQRKSKLSGMAEQYKWLCHYMNRNSGELLSKLQAAFDERRRIDNLRQTNAEDNDFACFNDFADKQKKFAEEFIEVNKELAKVYEPVKWWQFWRMF